MHAQQSKEEKNVNGVPCSRSDWVILVEHPVTLYRKFSISRKRFILIGQLGAISDFITFLRHGLGNQQPWHLGNQQPWHLGRPRRVSFFATICSARLRSLHGSLDRLGERLFIFYLFRDQTLATSNLGTLATSNLGTRHLAFEVFTFSTVLRIKHIFFFIIKIRTLALGTEIRRIVVTDKQDPLAFN